jgi:hypothetical protein
MGVTRIPRVVKQAPAKSAAAALPKVALGPKAAVAIPGVAAAAAPAAPAVPGKPKLAGFTLRFGEGKVRESVLLAC